MVRPSTGLRPLDDLLGGLRVGDNVVWEAEEDTTLDPFVAAFVRRSARGPGLGYVSFHVSPAIVLDRLLEDWDPERFVLVDCFTEGLGRGEETFRRFYRSRRGRGVRVLRIREPADPAAAHAELADVERELGPGARYVFDSLTGMQELWGSDAALAFFLRSCPRLYELRTVAYWLLDRSAHDPSFLSRLGHVTQVVLGIRAEDEGQTLKVVKSEGRPPEVAGREGRFVFDGGRVRVVRETPGTRERIGNVLRAQRVARGLSQAEFARRIGISPSALSQAERGRIGLSGETLTRAWEALGLPFGPGVAPRAPSYKVTRRGERGQFQVLPGLQADEVVDSGAAVYLLTFSPGARGRRPPFATKRPEIVVVVTGLLEIRVGEAKETLQAGDALVLQGETVGAWRNPGPDDARALWTILP